MSKGVAWHSAFVSHQGAVRSVNEDFFLDAPDIGMWAVADGMGGHEAGQLASSLIVDALDTMPEADGTEQRVSVVRQRLNSVNHRLRTIAQERFAGRIIGSTVAVLLADDDGATCLWAGDSRIYLHREGQLRRLTRDHSKVEELIAEGLLHPEDAEGHRLANVITRAVGAQEELVLEICFEPARVGDRFLICSDGLTKTLADAELADLLINGRSQDTAERIMSLCLQRRPTDNVTLGVIHLLDAFDEEATAPQPVG